VRRGRDRSGGPGGGNETGNHPRIIAHELGSAARWGRPDGHPIMLRGRPMRPVPAGAVLLVVSVIVGAPPRVFADATQARAHFEKGRTFFQIDEYRKAIDEFKAAHVERP